MIYDLMLELPVFQGLSHDQLTAIVEKVPFHFKKFRPNDYLVNAGDNCNEVLFLLSGRVRVVTPIYKDSILIAEDFEAPHTITFYNLFGRDTTTRSSIYAQGQVGVMAINKENFLRMIETNRLMLINVLNILSSHAQKQHLTMDCMGERLPQLRLATWLLAYTSQPARNIFVDADPKDWCSLLGFDLDSFKDAVGTLIKLNCIECDGGKIKLIDRYGLQRYVSRNIARN